MRGGLLVENQVAVDFVGDEDEVVGFAEAGEALDFLLGKNPAEWVLWVAEQKDSCGGRDGVFHGGPIELPTAIDLHMIDGDQLHPWSVAVDAEERRIDGRARHHGFAGLAKGAGGKRERRNEAAEVGDPLRIDVVRVATGLEVFEERGFEAGLRLGVAENPVIDAAVESVEDFGG